MHLLLLSSDLSIGDSSRLFLNAMTIFVDVFYLLNIVLTRSIIFVKNGYKGHWDNTCISIMNRICRNKTTEANSIAKFTSE